MKSYLNIKQRHVVVRFIKVAIRNQYTYWFLSWTQQVIHSQKHKRHLMGKTESKNSQSEIKIHIYIT